MAIDLTTYEMQFLLKQFEKANVVLFAGAGFSTDAISGAGQHPPLGADLAVKLAAACGWKHEGEELPVVFEQAQKHLGTRALDELLASLYQQCKPAAWHRLTASIIWHRIYTTNIDDVLEQVYAKGGAQSVEPIVCPAPYIDPDPWLGSVQCVHLHGSVLDRSKPLTFSIQEFAKQTVVTNPWYQALVEDMHSRSVLFVGTKLTEAPFHHYLALREERPEGRKEVRARAFLVSPHVNAIMRRQLQDKGIVVVDSFAAAFFESVVPHIHARVADRTAVLKNRYPHHIRAIESGLLETQTSFLKQFELVSDGPAEAVTRSHFFLGAEPTWQDIRNGVDAERQISEPLRVASAAAVSGLRAIVIMGQAGSGKSTALRRACVELTRQGHIVYFLKSSDRLDMKAAGDVLQSLNGRHVFFAIDDAAFHIEAVEALTKTTTGTINATFLLAERPHVISPSLGAIRHLEPIVFEMPNLDQAECNRILDKLDSFGFLGTLKGRSRGEQLREFLGRSRKQLLVAMKEATSGRGFDAIISHEFFQLATDDARLAYTIACLVYQHGTPVRRRHLLACLDGRDYERSAVLREQLLGVVVPWRENDELLSPRHRVIAHLVVTEAAPLPVREAALRTYLSQIAGDVTPEAIRRRSPEYIGYRGLINFDGMLQLFGPAVDTIRGIYADMKGYYRDDFLFWLQYGKAELYFDNFEEAENYLQQSIGMKGTGNFQAEHHLGVLYLKRGCAASDAVAGHQDAERGEQLLRGQIQQGGRNEAYASAALITHKLRFLRKWGSPRLGSDMEELQRLATNALQRHPFDDAVKVAHEEITRAYLMQAVPQQQRSVR